MSSNQDQIVKAMNSLPDEMTPDEFEALLCALVSMHVDDDEIPAFFEYMATKIRMMTQLEMLRAERETKH